MTGTIEFLTLIFIGSATLFTLVATVALIDYLRQ